MSGKNPPAQAVQVMATPSVNRRKDVFGDVSGLSRKFNGVPETDEIPSSSAVQVISCTPKGRGDCATTRPSRHLSTIHEQTPTRGPLKLIDSRSSLTSIGNRPETGDRPFGMLSAVNGATPSLNKTDPKHLALFPSVTFKTPTKIRSTDPQRRNLHGEVEDTPLKVSRDALGTTQEKPTPINAADENSVSIYDSLGWNDDVDELS